MSLLSRHDSTVRVLNCVHRSHLGGAQKSIVWIANLLQKQGIETTILFPKDKEVEYELLLHERGLDYVRLRFAYLRSMRHLVTNLWFVLTLPWAVWGVIKIIRKRHINIVHVNGITNLQPVLAALLCRKPVVWHLNDMLAPRSFIRLMSPLFRHRLVQMAVVTPAIVSHYDVKELSSSGWRTLPAPFFPDTPNPQKSAQLKQSVGLTEGDHVLGFVGNFTPLKGVHDFVDAATALMKDDDGLHAVIVGASFHSQSVYSQKIRDKVSATGMEERFHLLGYQSDVPAWLRLFDVLVFSSYSEACPIVVLEAMNAGLPLVATRVGEVPSMLENIDIPLVEPGDLAGLIAGANCMFELSAEETAHLGLLMRQRAHTRYSLDMVATLHSEIYGHLTKAETTTTAEEQ